MLEDMNSLMQEPEKVSSINNNKPNILSRISIAFERRFMQVNKQREENEVKGLSRPLSRPKFTELVVKHKLWPKIQEDIINYKLDEEDY